LCREYLQPATFVYYVPSIILGACRAPDFICDALEVIIPHNQKHVPRGQWWFEFAGVVSPTQRKAFLAFLADVRRTAWDAIGLSSQEWLTIAEGIWARH